MRPALAVLLAVLLAGALAQAPPPKPEGAAAPAIEDPNKPAAVVASPEAVAPAPSPLSVDTVFKRLDSPLQDIQWATDDTVFVLTEKGTLLRSADAGRSWKSQLPKMQARAGGPIKISAIYMSESEPSKAVFLTSDRGYWTTSDMGNTYTEGQLLLRDLRLHPVQSSWLLGSTMSDGCDAHKRKTKGAPQEMYCFKILWVSKDFGATWQHCIDYVVQFDWSPAVGQPAAGGGYPESDNLVYATINTEKKGNQKFGVWDKNIQFVASSDYFKNFQVLVPHGNRFLFGNHAYLFVAAVNPKDETQVSLRISRDNDTFLDFHDAVLPVELREHSYTILDTSEGAVFLHVNHQPFTENAYAGHVYSSDWSGLVYTLALPYNHRAPDGKCDFEKVEGLEGIYIANFIDENEMDQEDQKAKNTANEHARSKAGKSPRPAMRKRHERLHTKTVITFDKGASWSYLPAPKVGSDGKPIKCTGECHLHLHGITDLYGPVYSAASGLGLIMATGTVGTYLQQNMDQLNTYLSRDAGLTWKEVKKGSHIYEFGDHGSLIVIAPDTQATDTVFYSWDEGATWTPLKIADEKFNVENIIIEPDAETEQFIVYGWDAADNTGVIVFLDFDSLHTKHCTGYDAPDTERSDYETWSPSDGRLKGKCLMGHKATYVRRKQDRPCFNPEKFNRPIAREDCPCSIKDFECDHGFERKIGQEECLPMKEKPDFANPFEEDETCLGDSQTFRTTKGYRRVPGNTCIGGAEWDAIVSSCPSAWSQSNAGRLVGGVFLFAVVGLFLVACGSKYDCMDSVKGFLEKRVGLRFRYSRLDRNRLPQPETAADDEEFGASLDDDDFSSQQAHLIDTGDRRGNVQAGSKRKGQADDDFNPRRREAV